MTTARAATQRKAKPAEGQVGMDREVLGDIDIGVGLPDDAWSAIPAGIPDAMETSLDPSWDRKTALDKATPKARPGYVQRWVRIATEEGKPDIANKAEALMVGWRPRREGTLESADIGMPIYDAGDGKGGVIVFKGQLLLCEIKEEMHAALLKRMQAEESEIHRTIYQDARKNHGMPERYATLDYDSGRGSAELIDNSI